MELSEGNKKQFFISKGFAHSFLVLSDYAEFCYKVDDFLHPNDKGGIAYDDPTINVKWPISSDMVLNLSEKDKTWKPLK
ncbi:dTDP-4-dehydrorhamnose 3,5-epimerase [Eubacterium sp.]|uniref:dTDP-4-dehydrorhamnose 3,5-epimerase n=1 Tax=Eubacterium sp. TaxID=142586 RepID=UPI004026521F